MLIGMPRITLFTCLVLATWLATASVADVETAEFRQQRADFLSAERDLRNGQISRFRAKIEDLRDYPLYPYLRYEYLRQRLTTAAEDELADFMRDYADSPLGDRLRGAWLDTLARNGRWRTLLRHYPMDTGNTELDCYRRLALYRSDEREAAFDGLERLWLVARSQPRSCDRIFSLWRQHGLLTSDLAWRRFVLVMNNNEIRLARYLLQMMGPEHKAGAELWLRVHSDPGLVVSLPQAARDHPARNSFLIHGIKRLARADIDKAVRAWAKSVSARYDFTPEESAEVHRSLAMTLALRGRKEAMDWLTMIDAAAADATLREWRVRAAISQSDWSAALSAIYQLTEDEQTTPRWRYWQARALDALNQRQQADEILLGLALSRGYYSFLAADHLQWSYQLNHAPVDMEVAGSVTPDEYPGVARARELFKLDRLADARREWYYATRDMTDRQLQSAAMLAHGWGWHDRAIVTVARSTHPDDMELRFPLVHREQVTAEAEKRGVDPALAFAVIRQESAFAADARSSAGALGLMQLLPQTANKLASHLNMPPANRMNLLDVSTNLQLGLTFLRRLIDRYENQMVAAAAYNAGPGRVNQWLPYDDVVKADLWAETVPFLETRNYIQNVVYFASIYDQRLGQPVRRLNERMPPVLPRNARLDREAPGTSERTEGGLSADANS